VGEGLADRGGISFPLLAKLSRIVVLVVPYFGEIEAEGTKISVESVWSA
jgi:hypothetical protein